jgi:C4-dicarboxylate-binding protein DctP
MNEKRRVGFSSVVTGLLVFMLFFAFSAVRSEATNFRLIIGAGHSRGAALWVDRFEDFFAAEVKKRVEATTPHKIEWVTAWGGSVAKLDESLEAVQEGSLDFANIPYQFEPTKLFLHGWTQYMPFASPDPILTSRVGNKIHRSIPYLTEVFEKQYNQKFLSCHSLSSYHIITNFPWKKFEELKGRKIAAAGANLLWLKGTGAVPVQSNLQEAYSSLQTGVYDGWIMFVEGAAGFKLYEVAKYYTFCDFGSIIPAAYTVNLKRWKSFPKEVQDIILKVGDELSEDIAKAIVARTDSAVEAMKKAGAQIYQLPVEEKVKWVNSLPNIADEKAKEADKKGMPGTQVMKAYLEEMEKAGFKWPRRWEIK